MLYLIVGLGNPGKKYQLTRHNIGFMVVERLSEKWGVPLTKKQFSGVLGLGSMGEHRVGLLKPLTFMNLSGQAVASTAGYYNVEGAALAVVHDDVDLALGRLQVRQNGGHGGHRGLMSIAQQLGYADFIRFRVGINRPDPKMETADYVLSTFSEAEREAVWEVIESTCAAIETWIREGLTTAMNRYNSRPRTSDPENDPGPKT